MTKTVRKLEGFRRFWQFFMARRRGTKDGRVNIPAADTEDDFPSALHGIKKDGEGNLATISEVWADEDKKLKGDYCGLLSEYRQTHEELKREQDEVEEDEDLHEKRFADLEQHLRKSGIHRADGLKMSHTTYWAVMVAIGLGELPLNAVAFRLFGEAEVFTWGVTAALAVTLVLSAHLVGGILRQEQLTRREWVLLAAWVTAPLAVVAFVSFVREGYLSAFGVDLGAELDRTTKTVTFGLINVLVYVVAVGMSYVAHNPREARRRELERAIVKAEEPLEKTKSQLVAVRVRMNDLEIAVQEARATRENRWEEIRSWALAIQNYFESLMHAYVEANVRTRDDHKPPPVLRKLPEIKVPKTLVAEELDWDCQDLLRSVVSEARAERGGAGSGS